MDEGDLQGLVKGEVSVQELRRPALGVCGVLVEEVDARPGGDELAGAGEVLCRVHGTAGCVPDQHAQAWDGEGDGSSNGPGPIHGCPAGGSDSELPRT